MRPSRAAACGLFQKSGLALSCSSDSSSAESFAKSKMPPEFLDVFPQRASSGAHVVKHRFSFVLGREAAGIRVTSDQ